MKKLLIVLAFVLTLACSFSARATPYLVTNPDAGATSFTVSGLPSGFVVTTAPDPAGTYGLKTDLALLPSGSYTVTVQACLTDATWGQVCSAASPPFSFTRPAGPLIPAGTGLAK